MRPTSRQDLVDIAAILALDWLVVPRTGLEYLASVESGRRWNDSVRSRATTQTKGNNERRQVVRRGLLGD